MFGHTVFACLLACLACVSALPPSLLAYTGESGEPTLLDCTETTSTTYRCQLVKREDISQYSHNQGVLEKEEDEAAAAPEIAEEEDDDDDDDEAALEITEKDEISQVSPQEEMEASMGSRFVVSIPGQEAARIPKCQVFEIYVPEMNECVDVIDHLNAPALKDPRVANWYNWRNAIIAARRKTRGF